MDSNNSNHPIWRIGLYRKLDPTDKVECLACGTQLTLSDGSIKSLMMHLFSKRHKQSPYAEAYMALALQSEKPISMPVQCGRATMIDPNEKRDVLALIRDNWPMLRLDNRAVDRATRQAQWNAIYQHCCRLGHQWTKDKDERWLPGRAWPKWRDDYNSKLKRCTDRGANWNGRMNERDRIIEQIIHMDNMAPGTEVILANESMGMASTLPVPMQANRGQKRPAAAEEFGQMIPSQHHFLERNAQQQHLFGFNLPSTSADASQNNADAMNSDDVIPLPNGTHKVEPLEEELCFLTPESQRQNDNNCVKNDCTTNDLLARVGCTAQIKVLEQIPVSHTNATNAVNTTQPIHSFSMPSSSSGMPFANGFTATTIATTCPNSQLDSFNYQDNQTEQNGAQMNGFESGQSADQSFSQNKEALELRILARKERMLEKKEWLLDLQIMQLEKQMNLPHKFAKLPLPNQQQFNS